ncbi:alpha/beta fold hydrolase [Paenibacillus sp. CF384]|uniref:alpha/beta fold hydrolase n=1 Tax=Paenibacillus sp. CF384 TaxID=1884382 RepID=UPI00089B429B|nr:alpha/beta hydrolase [Paenibacillus sp. CF384]SDX70895.1 Pimeloyl-ACP methyl ester carboxylesterase [Paenibacillus sp. CF384]
MNAINLTAQTVPTSYIEAGGTRYAYRKLGKPSDIPLVLLNRFRGTMDDWDPAFVNALAMNRTVIYFDNLGIGLSSGETQDQIAGMAEGAVGLIKALGLEQIDLLGFSMGGFVAQQLTVANPKLVRKLILAGTSGASKEDEQTVKEAFQVAIKPVNTEEDFLYIFFEDSEISQAAGRDYWSRLQERQDDRSPLVKAESIQAQGNALGSWKQQSVFDKLKNIPQPVLVANGSRDLMAPTFNSYLLYKQIPDAQLILYPDSGHGFLFQHASTFAEHIHLFLR